MSHLERHQTKKQWRVRWREGGRGSPQKSSEWYSKKVDAELFQAQIQGRKLAKKPASGRALMLLPEIIERWRERVKDKRSERYVQETCDLLHKLVADKNWKHTNDVTETDTLNVGTYRLIRALLKFAHLRYGQPLPSLLPPDQPKKQPEADLLELPEVSALIAAAAEWSDGAGAIAHLVAMYGHRPESLVHLPCKAVRDGKLFLTVKSGDEVAHQLLKDSYLLLERLKGNRKPSEPLFLNAEGKPWKNGHAYSGFFFHRVGNHKLGIYQLKRFALTRMLSAGLDVATIASITGHRTPLTILRYARTNQARQKMALDAILALGAPSVLPAQ